MAASTSASHAIAAVICTDHCSVFALACAQVRTKPWYEPQYFITILGMVLGNCISSISVGLSALLDDLTTGTTNNSAWLDQYHCFDKGKCAPLWFTALLAAAHRCMLHGRAHTQELLPLEAYADQCSPAVAAENAAISSLLLHAAKDKIELLLSLGATRWEATRETVARCVKLALTPILNQMNVVVRCAAALPAATERPL